MDAAATSNDSSNRVQWMFQVSYPDWQPFLSITNMIIEEAYQANEPYAIIDDGHLDFRRMVYNHNNELAIKRKTLNLQDCDYVPTNRSKEMYTRTYYGKASNVNRPGTFGDFIWEAYLLGQWRDVPQSILVERAAQGIIEEGKKRVAPRTAEWMAKHLLEVKHGTRKQIWRRCVYLYTADSFLYTRLNQSLSMRNTAGYEQEWREILQTLGLFAWFLFDFPQDVDEFEGHVYRGIQLNNEDISYFKIAAEKDELLAFPTFTSTSRNRSVAEEFADSLLIISIVRSRETSVDVSALSNYPSEEEQLLIPGFLFKVTRVEFDSAKNKHIIYLQDCNNQ